MGQMFKADYLIPVLIMHECIALISRVTSSPLPYWALLRYCIDKSIPIILARPPVVSINWRR
jgi:hypothetical protein